MLRTLQAVLLRPAIAAWLLSSAAEWRRYPQPTDEPVIEVEGPNRLRVLLLGGGLAIGYGVATHNLGVGGFLARKLAAETGRGTRVEVQGTTRLTAKTAAKLVNQLDLSDFDAVLILLGGNDAFTLLPTRAWNDSVSAIFDGVERQPSERVRHIFALGIPPISSIVEVPAWATAAISSRVQHFNERTEALSALGPTRSYIPMTSNGLRIGSMTEPKPYSHWATEIASVMAETFRE